MTLHFFLEFTRKISYFLWSKTAGLAVVHNKKAEGLFVTNLLKKAEFLPFLFPLPETAAATDSRFLPSQEAEKHFFESREIRCLARQRTGKMTDKRRQIRLTESVSCAG